MVQCKCSNCQYAEYLSCSQRYSCKHKDCKEIHVFKGKTKPHYCPLTGGKKYTIHNNLGRNTGNVSRDMIKGHYYS